MVNSWNFVPFSFILLSDCICDVFDVIKSFKLLVAFVLFASKQQTPIDIGFPTQKNDNMSIINSKKYSLKNTRGLLVWLSFRCIFNLCFFKVFFFKYCKYLWPVFVV